MSRRLANGEAGAINGNGSHGSVSHGQSLMEALAQHESHLVKTGMDTRRTLATRHKLLTSLNQPSERQRKR